MRKLRIVLWALVVFAAGLAAWNFADLSAEDQLANNAVRIGGPFSMTDHNGTAVTDKTYSGKAMAIFFGFTYCPDICPTTLARMSGLVAKLGPDAARLQVILVSVDPERDTPQVLKEYLASFDPGFVGLTGTPEQLASFAKTYRAFYEKVPTDAGEYTMNHTAGVFLFNSQGEFSGTLDAHEKDEVALEKLKRLVSR
jgi:protein SCO1/2